MADDTCVYFAYGSNLHPLRLQERVPSASLLGVSRLSRHKMIYGKRGMDGSGKCTTVYGYSESDEVIGALYALRRDQLDALDAAEGPAYGRKSADFLLLDEQISGFYYEALENSVDNDLLPFDWYRDLVVAGALYHRLPHAYRAALANTATRRDPDRRREALMHALLVRMSLD